MSSVGRAVGRLREHALRLPGASEHFPWGDRVMKVGRKMFAILGSVDDPSSHLTLKLTESHEAALDVDGAEPTGYGLGKTGWVTFRADAHLPPIATLRRWLEESYHAVAPKRTPLRRR